MKTDKNYNIGAQEGLSLIELLIVVVIISVVASLALYQRGNTNEHFKRQNVARELKVLFERARYDSVKRRADGTADYPYAYVEIFPTSFTLRTFNGTDAVNQPYPFPANIVASGYGFTIDDTGVKVEFNRRGEATVVGGINQPQFMVCNGAECPAEPGDAATTNTVLVTPTGTVNLLGGGIAIPTFTTPPVATPVPVIRQEVVLP